MIAQIAENNPFRPIFPIDRVVSRVHACLETQREPDEIFMTIRWHLESGEPINWVSTRDEKKDIFVWTGY